MKGQAELDRFIESLRADKRSDETIYGYKGKISRMLRYIDKEVENITFEDLDRYKRYLADRGQSKYTIRTNILSIKRFFRFLGLGKIVMSLTMPPKPKNLPVYLNQEEAYRMLEEAKSNVRDYAIIITYLDEGLRLSELRNLNIRDIDFEEKVIRIRHGKGDKDGVVPLNPEVEDAIKDYLLYRQQCSIHPRYRDDAIFLSKFGRRISKVQLNRIVHEYVARAGIKKNITPHKLRHTCLTHLYQRTHDIYLCKEIARHSSVKTTEIYVNPMQEYVTKAYNESGLGFSVKPRFHSENTLRKEKSELNYFG